VRDTKIGHDNQRVTKSVSMFRAGHIQASDRTLFFAPAPCFLFRSSVLETNVEGTTGAGANVVSHMNLCFQTRNRNKFRRSPHGVYVSRFVSGKLSTLT
jgi:hypothetical protein